MYICWNMNAAGHPMRDFSYFIRPSVKFALLSLNEFMENHLFTSFHFTCGFIITCCLRKTHWFAVKIKCRKNNKKIKYSANLFFLSLKHKLWLQFANSRKLSESKIVCTSEERQDAPQTGILFNQPTSICHRNKQLQSGISIDFYISLGCTNLHNIITLVIIEWQTSIGLDWIESQFSDATFFMIAAVCRICLALHLDQKHGFSIILVMYANLPLGVVSMFCSMLNHTYALAVFHHCCAIPISWLCAIVLFFFFALNCL